MNSLHTQFLLVDIQCTSVLVMLLWHGQIMVIRCRLNILEYHKIFILEFDNCFWTLASDNIAKYTCFFLSHLGLGTCVGWKYVGHTIQHQSSFVYFSFTICSELDNEKFLFSCKFR